ncbi:hypothetical protein BH18ACT8_BH18ACT8_06050 [soil metagenome]
MRSRGTVRIIAIGWPAAAVLSAPPAAADTPTTWPEPEPMSTLDALLLFVGVPAGLFVLIALLVMAPSVVKGPRYRPGLSWWARPEWFGGPTEGEGAHRLALEAGDGSDDAPASTHVERTGGGASARW